MTSPSTDSSRDPAEFEQQAASANSAHEDSTTDPPRQDSSSPASSGQSSDRDDEAKERRKIKIGSQREGAPKIRMQRRTFTDSTLPTGTAIAAPVAPRPPPKSPSSEKTAAPAAPDIAATNADDALASKAPSVPDAAVSPQPEAESAASKAAAAPTAPSETAPHQISPLWQAPAPQATAPQVTAPQATAPQATAPQATAPQATAPQVTAPPPPVTDATEAAAPAQESRPPRRAEPVEVPRLNQELDDEVEAALGGMSIDDIIAQEDKPQTGAELEPDTRRRGIVLRVHREDVFFSVGARHEAVTPLKYFSKPPEPGDQIDVIVARFNADEGLYEVTVPGAAADVGDWEDITEGTVVEARVTGSNTGGLECQVNHIRGFIPASQISLYRVENFGEYAGQKLLCVVTEANPQRRNLVLSHRAVLEREKEQAREGFLAQLEVGQVHEGTVRSLRDFGAFVDLGGVDGLIHISKLSWDRVNHPNEVLEEGQRVKVKIEKIDRQTGKIGLSYRDLLEDPWDNVEQKYPVGTAVEGTVSRIAQFGAFVKLEPGVEGLVHVSELAHHRVANVGSYVKQGQTVQVKVVSVDRAAQRIGLSMKALQQVADTGSSRKDEEAADEPPRELAVPKRKGPLKGGLGRSSGGEQFGLNW
jgi:small subunit ribosomal protein S1